MGRIFKGIDFIEKTGIVIGLSIMVVMNFVNVVCRFLLPQTPFSYTEELTNLVFVWITMLGISMGYRTFSHTGLSMVTERMTLKMQVGMAVFAAACTIVLMVFVMKSGLETVSNQIKFHSNFPGLKISKVYGSIAMPMGALLISVSAVSAAAERIKQLREQMGGEEKL